MPESSIRQWSTAWPFLIARGPTAGERTVMAPLFLIRQGSHRLLMLKATPSADLHPDAEGLLRSEVHDDHGGYTLVFRVLRPQSDLGDGGEGLVDAIGRPVFLTEGVVLTGTGTVLDAEMFEAAHTTAMEVFWWFWRTDGRQRATVPAPLLVPGQTPVLDLSPIGIHVEEPRPHDPLPPPVEPHQAREPDPISPRQTGPGTRRLSARAKLWAVGIPVILAAIGLLTWLVFPRPGPGSLTICCGSTKSSTNRGVSCCPPTTPGQTTAAPQAP